MPVACVALSLNTEIHQEMPLFYGSLLNSPFITDTDSLHHSGGTDTLFFICSDMPYPPIAIMFVLLLSDPDARSSGPRVLHNTACSMAFLSSL